MNTKIQQVRILKKRINNSNVSKKTLTLRKVRLKALVDDYGHELVAEAAGLQVSSIVTYLKAKHPRIAEPSLSQAENILSKL